MPYKAIKKIKTFKQTRLIIVSYIVYIEKFLKRRDVHSIHQIQPKFFISQWIPPPPRLSWVDFVLARFSTQKPDPTEAIKILRNTCTLNLLV